MTWQEVAAFAIFAAGLALVAIQVSKALDRQQQRAHERALHDANAAVRQEAFGSLMKRTEAAETEMLRLTEKVTTLQNRVGRA